MPLDKNKANQDGRGAGVAYYKIFSDYSQWLQSVITVSDYSQWLQSVITVSDYS